MSSAANFATLSNVVNAPSFLSSLRSSQMGADYRDACPHGGYSALQKMAGTFESTYVYTSNVDGHFLRTGGFGGGNVCEIHGNAGSWRCAAKMGIDEGGGER